MIDTLEERHLMLARKLAEEVCDMIARVERVAEDVMDLTARIGRVEELFLDLHTNILRAESCLNEHKDLYSRLCKLEELHKTFLWEMEVNDGK